MILELARGAKPELFTGHTRSNKKTGKRTEKVPLTGNTISALQVFLQPGVPSHG